MNSNLITHGHSDQFYVHVALKNESKETSWFGRTITIFFLKDTQYKNLATKGKNLVLQGEASAEDYMHIQLKKTQNMHWMIRGAALSIPNWINDEQKLQLESEGRSYIKQKVASAFKAFVDKFSIEEASVQSAVQVLIGKLDELNKLGFGGIDLKHARLALCQKFARQEFWAAKALAENFDKLGLEDDERLTLCEMIAKQVWRAADALAENFDKLGLKGNERLTLCQTIAKEGEYAAETLAYNFDKLGLEDDERLVLYQTIAEQGIRAAEALMDNFDKLGLKGNERLVLCQTIAEQGIRAVKALVDNFDKLNLEGGERLKLCQTIVKKLDIDVRYLVDKFNKLGLESNERLAFCQIIAKQGTWAAYALAENFDKLGLEDDERLVLCQTIAEQGENAAKALVKNLDNLNLLNLKGSERLKLYQTIAKQGEDVSMTLLNDFDELRLKGNERMALCQTIAEQGIRVAKALAYNLASNFDKLRLKGDDLRHKRLALCQTIAQQGEDAAASLANNFDKLGLEGDDLRYKRLALCQTIAQQGVNAPRHLLRNFDSLGLESDDLRLERLAFCQALCDNLATRGRDGANIVATALAYNFDKLGLEGDDLLLERLKLCQKIAQQGESTAAALAKNFDKLDLKGNERLALCQTIAEQGENAAKALVKNLDKLALKGDDLRLERLEFIQIIADKMTAAQFIDIYHRLMKMNRCAESLELLQSQLISKVRAAFDPDTGLAENARLNLARTILREHERLNLDLEAPIVLEAMRMVSIIEGNASTNPYALYTRLKELARQPTDFQPPLVTLGNSQAQINLAVLESLAPTIERKDLPKNVSMETFTTFINGLRNKLVEINERGKEITRVEAEGPLQQLDATWAQISVPLFDDPDQYLFKLLQKEAGQVSDAEAKFKAVLSMIFDRSSRKAEDAFLTPQEESFILMMKGIQNCAGGKQYGISFAYQQLEPKYRYQAQLAQPIEGDELQQANRESALAGFKNYFKSHPANVEDLIKASQDQSNENQQNIIKWASGLEADLDTDEDGILFFLTEEGAKQVLEMVKTSVLAETRPLLASLIQHVLANQLEKGALMDSLTGEKNISQASHYILYVHNLIGPVLGLKRSVDFDIYTNMLSDQLVAKSREEVLDIFFQQLTPAVLVKELMIHINKLSPEEKDHLRFLVPEAHYWESDAINSAGTIKILQMLALLKI